MDELITIFWSAAFLAAAIRLSVPIMLAGIGEAISERGGVINIGLEGMMLAGAFGAVVGSHLTGNAWLGLLCGMAAAVVITLPHGFISINLGGDQIVSGVSLNLVALGLTTFLFRQMFGITDQPQVAGFEPLDLPMLSDLPVLGAAIFSQSILFFVAVGLGLVLWLVLFRTRPGLRWRAAGDDPAALDSVGIPVFRTRWAALLVCAALAGMAGAAISLGQLFTFIENMTGGAGYVALALVIVARWNPLWAIVVAVAFGAAEAIAVRIQAGGITLIPYQLSLMLPYVLTLIVYALAARSGRAPRALGKPFVK
jgi:simple sugar transport system permease protein